MSTPQFASVPGGFADIKIVSFIAASLTNAKVLADVSPASGNYLGGQRAYDIVATSTDSVDNALTVWEGVQATQQANMGTAAVTANTNATATRTTGSFITDGWNVGEVAMLFGALTAANNGVPLIVTAVAAGTLTFSGVPSGFTAETETSSAFRLVRVARRAPIKVPANSGNATGTSPSIPNVQIVGQGLDQTRDPLGIEIGANSLLIVAPYQAVSALPAVLQVSAHCALR